jgi:hypothetical protein
MKKSRKWWAFLSGEVYANDYYFDNPISEKEFRAYLRRYYNTNNLRNFQIWIG